MLRENINVFGGETAPEEEFLFNREREAKNNLENKGNIEKKGWDEIMSSKVFSDATKELLEAPGNDIAVVALKESNEFNQETFAHIASSLNLCTELMSHYEKDGRLSSEDASLIFNAVATHDWGKSYIEEKLLKKKGRLDAEEELKMQKHPLASAEELIARKQFKLAAIVVRHHIFDNQKSYPDDGEIAKLFEKYLDKDYAVELLADPKLKSFSKIISIIDRVEAMLTDKRSYKEGMWRDQVKDILRNDFPDFANFIEMAVDKWRE